MNLNGYKWFNLDKYLHNIYLPKYFYREKSFTINNCSARNFMERNGTNLFTVRRRVANR